MSQISNLNTQVNQNLPNQAGTAQVGTAVPLRPVTRPLAGIQSGTLVEGQVLAQNPDGSYSVRIDGEGARAAQTLRARATLSLIVGERFRAVWDATGRDGVPTLRLSQGELSFLAQVPPRDRGLATALLARGLPLSGEAVAVLRDAWRRMGGEPETLSSLIELWARGADLTPKNAALLSQYMALSGAEATEVWNRIRRELRERAQNGEDPLKVLRSMKEEDSATGDFLKAHSLLMRSPRQEVNPALLCAPFWPSQDDSLTARVFVGRVAEEEGRRYWQVGFGVEGSALGLVGGYVESDGRSCNLALNAEVAETCALIDSKRGEICRELEGTDLPVRFIGITQNSLSRLRDRLVRGRGLDVTV